MAKSNPSSNTARSTKPKGSAAKPRSSGGSKTKSAAPDNRSGLSDGAKREIRAIVFVFVCFMLAMSYYTPFFGIVGRLVKNIGMWFFGSVAYVIPVFSVVAGVHMIVKGSLKPHTYRYAAALLVLVCVSGLLSVHSYRLNPTLFGSGYTADEIAAAFERNPDFMPYKYSGAIDLLSNIVSAAKNGNGGGIFGFLASVLFIRLFSPIGTIVLLWALILVLTVLATGKAPFLGIARLLREKLRAAQERAAEEDEEDGEEDVPFGEIEPINYTPTEPRKLRARRSRDEEKEKKPKENAVLAGLKKLIFVDEEEPPKKKKSGKNGKKKSGKSNGGEKPLKKSSTKKVEPEIVAPVEPEPEKVRVNMYDSSPENVPDEAMELAMAENGVTPEPKPDTTPIPVTDDEMEFDYIPYEFPPMKLLGRDKPSKDSTSQDDVRRMGQKLIDTLRSFGVEAKINEITRGPAITRFEISPATGVKVSKIINLSNDIALNLAAVSVRVIAPIPGKAAVGIEIPNEKISTVRLRDVIDSDEFRNFKSKTAFALGKDVNGRVIVADIAKMPHLLIAGATGSGKSVCINSLITSIIYKADPNEVKLIMIDPKVVELGVYNGIPHLLIPVVTDPRRAAGALNWAVQEMMKRYKLFAENNVRNLAGYNELAEMSGERKLEQIVIIVDELADLMMVSAKEVEDSIVRLAQLARAAGMHLVIATQRPSVDVITGLIKANVPSRIAFAVSNGVDSRTILDMGGAEKLLGKGDMLFLPMGANSPIRIQGAFVSDAETEAIVEYIKQDFSAKYDEDIMEHIERGADDGHSSRDDDDGEADDMLPAAIQAVVEAGQASASLLQRRLKVGYARAGRLIDQLEERGIIGPHEGSKPRAVLMSRSEYMEMQAMGGDE